MKMAKVLKTFVLLALVLCFLPAAAENYEPLDLSSKERYAVNLFLSNFTEVGVDAVDGWSSDMNLVDFAHDHMWFNDHEAYEYGEFFGDNNCRVSDDRIQEIIDAYFYRPETVDLSCTRFDYDGEYYYHCETGGWSDYGFAHTLGVYPVGNDKYFVSFVNFYSGQAWDNNVLDDGLEEILSVHGEPFAYGSALVYAEDLSERSTYRMISYALL